MTNKHYEQQNIDAHAYMITHINKYVYINK